MADEMLPMSEQSSILKAVFDFIQGEYENIQFETLESKYTSLGLFSQQGSKYVRKDILGGFTGIIPFYISYRSSPQDDYNKIAMIDYLNTLSEWMLSQEYPSLTDNRTISLIEPTSIPFMDELVENGTITYIQTFDIKYRKDV